MTMNQTPNSNSRLSCNPYHTIGDSYKGGEKETASAELSDVKSRGTSSDREEEMGAM
jgi:hypothetical protein